MKATLRTINTSDKNDQLLQDSIQRALDQVRAYSPKTPANWASPAPANVDDALDRIASLLFTLNSGAAIP